MEQRLDDDLIRQAVSVIRGRQAVAADRYNVPGYGLYAACKGSVEVVSRYIAKEAVQRQRLEATGGFSVACCHPNYFIVHNGRSPILSRGGRIT